MRANFGYTELIACILCAEVCHCGRNTDENARPLVPFDNVARSCLRGTVCGFTLRFGAANLLFLVLVMVGYEYAGWFRDSDGDAIRFLSRCARVNCLGEQK